MHLSHLSLDKELHLKKENFNPLIFTDLKISSRNDIEPIDLWTRTFCDDMNVLYPVQCNSHKLQGATAHWKVATELETECLVFNVKDCI